VVVNDFSSKFLVRTPVAPAPQHISKAVGAHQPNVACFSFVIAAHISIPGKGITIQQKTLVRGAKKTEGSLSSTTSIRFFPYNLPVGICFEQPIIALSVVEAHIPIVRSSVSKNVITTSGLFLYLGGSFNISASVAMLGKNNKLLSLAEACQKQQQ